MTLRSYALIPALLMSASCASLVPAIEAPRPIGVSIPETYDHSPELAAARADDLEWWKGFNDPVLDDLITRALANNLSIESGIANLRSARAAVVSAGASLEPSASASASSSADTDTNLDDISVSGRLSASYELDLFGANRQSVEVSELNLQGTEYDQRALELSVQSSVANAYLNLLAGRYSLKVAEDNLAITKRIFDIVKVRYDAGDVSGYDMASQEASYASARARIPQIQDQIEGYEAALAILLGAAPQGFTVPDTSLTAIAIPGIETGLPSDLLLRRPDILQAQTSLRAAMVNVEIAQKAFLPSFDLGAGLSSILTNGLDPVASISASVGMPLFSGGQLEGSLESAEARADQAIVSYRQSILTALQDVDVSLSGLKAAHATEADLIQAERASARALEIAELRYRVGADNLTSLLNAQQSYQSASQSVVENRRDQLVSTVNVYSAIGSGWDATAG